LEKLHALMRLIRKHYANHFNIVHLKLLFNLVVIGLCMPDNFGEGIKIPSVEDTMIDIACRDNYRALLSVLLYRNYLSTVSYTNSVV